MIGKLKRIPKFFKEVREELKKVHWSSRREITAAAIVVVVVLTILTTYIAVIDLSFSRIIQILFQ